MSRIEKGLHEHHARLQAQAESNTPDATTQALPGSSMSGALEAPFAKVNSVVAGSPADAAGLKTGDAISKFGWVDWTNHDKLGRVAEAVAQNEGVSPPTLPRGLHKKIGASRHASHTVAGQVAAITRADESQLPITVKALRPSDSGGPSEPVTMTLTPRRNWGGRGMLGCHLLPL
jgi:26S proteasome non-ATPase regulatory subunit 9